MLARTGLLTSIEVTVSNSSYLVVYHLVLADNWYTNMHYYTRNLSHCLGESYSIKKGRSCIRVAIANLIHGNIIQGSPI